MNSNFTCPICKKRKGGNPAIDHSKCAKIMQKQRQEAMSQPHRDGKGNVVLWPGGKPITEDQYRRNVSKQVGRRYKTGKAGEFWKNFD